MTGRELRAALAAFRVSQAWFARRIGKHPSTVQRWCSAKEVPREAVAFVDMMRRLPSYELDDLIADPDNPNRSRGRPKQAA